MLAAALFLVCITCRVPVMALSVKSHARAMRAKALSALNAEKELYTVPCFPVHKRHRLPTDSLGLNLHEPRYLALADKVLALENRTFGAVYSGSSPHFIRDGVGLPTPMISPGQHGVFCEMITSSEIWTEVPLYGYKRKISTRSVVVGRFVVENVTKTGFDSHLGLDDGGSNMFIELSVTPVNDVPPVDSKDQEAAAAAEEELWTEIQKSQGFAIPDCEHLYGNPFETVKRFSPQDRNIDGKLSQDHVDQKALLERSFYAGACKHSSNSHGTEDAIETRDAGTKRRELFSFAVASFLELPDPEQAEWMLTCTDTAARLRRCTEILSSRRKSWQNIAKRVVNWNAGDEAVHF